MEQVKALIKSVHNRIHRLEDQRIALDETLVELRGIELQALAALEALKTAPLPPAQKPSNVTKTDVKARAANAAKGVKTIGRSS